MLIWVTLFTLLAPSFQAVDTLREYKALNFPGDSESFITLLPDTTPFKGVFSFCGWVQKQGAAGWPILLSYGGNELRIQDDGGHNCIFGAGLSLTSKFTVAKGTWFHYCSTWSSESRMFREYLDGELIASRATAQGRELQTGLPFTLGNWGDGGLEGLQFQGKMFNMNLYAREFSRLEVERLAGDMCALSEDLSSGAHRLSWGEILEQPRNGTVTEVDIGCLEPGELSNRLEAARSALELSGKSMETVEGKLNNILSGLETGTRPTLNSAARGDKLNITDLINLISDVDRKNRELARVTSLLERTVRMLETGLEGSDKFDSRRTVNKWDILYLDKYYNKKFTHELSEELRTSWDNVSGMYSTKY